MTLYYSDDAVTLWHGDCLDVLAELPDASVDSVVTDPPYGLEFMGKDWDRFTDAPPVRRSGWDHAASGAGFGTTQDGSTLPSYGGRWTNECTVCGRRDAFAGAKCRCPEGPSWQRVRTDGGATLVAFQRWCEQWATECLRVLKPGGHMLAFGGSRTWHRLACAVEDAGFEIRDSIAWLYGSGFPKSLDVSKAIDRAAGAEREIRRWRSTDSEAFGQAAGFVGRICLACGRHAGSVAANCQCEDAAPATPDAERWQGWGTALKPAFEPIVVARKPLTGTVAANVLTHGTGALNIDGCRVPTSEADKAAINAKHAGMDVETYERAPGASLNLSTNPIPLKAAQAHDAGRWPTNVVLDDTQAADLDRQSGVSVSRVGKPRGAASGDGWGMTATGAEYDDAGGASRFFPTFRYEAKAPTAERPRAGEVAHPTVKPLDLMRWLVRLVTPPGGTVLEPFAGSGTTAEACVIEGFRCIAIEREADYLPLIRARLEKPIQTALDLEGAVS